ncbi:hypothetical protein BGZ46_002209, partial [Entomortierella lignicola]
MPSLFSNWGNKLLARSRRGSSTSAATMPAPFSSSSSENSNISSYNSLPATSQRSPVISLPLSSQTLLPLSNPLTPIEAITTETPPSTSKIIRSPSRVPSVSSLSISSASPPNRPAPPPPRPTISNSFLIATSSNTSTSSSSSATPPLPPHHYPNSSISPKDKRSIIKIISLQTRKKKKQGPHPHSKLSPETCTSALPLNSQLHSSHSSCHPHSQFNSLPSAQTALSSTSNNNSSRSFKDSLKNSLKSRDIFNVKRYRRQGTTALINIEFEQKPLCNPPGMQQVEYMTDSQQAYHSQMHDGSTEQSTPAPVSISTSSQRSSKRMRPPLAEITTSTLSFSSLNPQSTNIPSNVNELSKSNNYTPSINNIDNDNIKSNNSSNHNQHNQHPETENMHLLQDQNPISAGSLLPLSISAVQHQPLCSNDGYPQEQDISATSQKIHAKKSSSRSHLPREAKAIRTRIRKLWQDPRRPENFKARNGPKNQYLLLEESLIGILQIVPLIIESAKAMPPSLGHLHSAGFPEIENNATTAPYSVTINTAESSAESTTALPSSPPLLGTSTNIPELPLNTSSSKKDGSSPTTPTYAHTHSRARTTSSNSASTASATRYQIATSILQPTEPNLTDIAQPAVRSLTSVSLLGEPALSAIAASAPSSSNATLSDKSSIIPQLAESNKMLVANLLTLSNTFKRAIKALYEQQNEKVLRFDDNMILDLLMRWEQEEDKEVPDSMEDSCVTSLVTLGATNALERYQITVGRVWEETEVILSSIRKIRDLVELGRINDHADFDADDSEEDVVERDEEAKRTLYASLLSHANSLVTVLGEFLECVSGIQRLVGSAKTQANSSNVDKEDMISNRSVSDSNYTQDTTMDFMPEEPRPIKHLDPALMRKLKRRTPFKSIAEKVRRSFSDFAKRSTTSLLTIFPPLGDGTNEGFNWDSYSDNEYDSEEWAPTDMDSFGDEDAFMRSLSPSENPSVASDKPIRRRGSRDSSSALPEQYWPGSIKLGLSDDSSSPVNPSSPSTSTVTSVPLFGGQAMAMSRSMSSERSTEMAAPRFYAGLPETPPISKISGASSYFPMVPESQTSSPKRGSVQLFRKSSQTSTFKGASISGPIPVATRSYSVYSSSSESQTPTRSNYKARPPKPPTALPPMPPSPVNTPSLFKEDGTLQGSTDFNQSPNRASVYLATKNTSPQQATPPTLGSHFVRRTSIRMANINRYSVKMPSDAISDQEVPGIGYQSSNAYWRRRSYNDALEKSWQALQLESQATQSEASAQSTPLTEEFDPIARLSVRMSTFEFPVPYGYGDTQYNRLSSVSTSSRTPSERHANRRHSSPLIPSAERILDEALSRATSASSRQSLHSSSQASPNNRNSVVMMPTLDEDSVHKRAVPRSLRSTDQLNFVEVDSLNIPLRPRVHHHHQKENSFDNNGNNATKPKQVDPGHKTPNENLTTPPPIPQSRYNDMKKAWEILNLDSKRLNQYSDMRANAQINSWAYNHPNAHQSASCPRAILIRENGIDVLVLEKIDERLQVVAGILENLIERLADQNEQDLLDRLIARFHIQPHQKEIIYFNQWHKVIQCKVLCVLNRWIQIQFEDFELNQNLLKTLKSFLEVDVRKCGFVIEADCIEKNISIRSRSPKKNCSVLMEQGRFCLQRSRARKISMSRSQSRLQSPTLPGLTTLSQEFIPTDSSLEYGSPPELLSGSPVLTLTALELARYLTLADMKAFRSITVFELMSGWWKKRHPPENKDLEDGAETPDDGPIEA